MFRGCLSVVVLLSLHSFAVSQERAAIVPQRNAARHGETKSAKFTPAYPAQSTLPSDIPWYEERESGKFEGEINEYFPVSIYTRCHYHGWQLCLQDFAISGRPLSECKWEPLGIGVAEPYTFRGHKDGYNACRENLAALVKLSDEKQVRRDAKRFYKPIEPWASWGRSRASWIYDKRAPGASSELLRGPGPKPAVRPGK